MPDRMAQKLNMTANVASFAFIILCNQVSLSVKFDCKGRLRMERYKT
jgi:hypothetical protein